MRKLVTRMAAGTILILMVLLPLGPAAGQPFSQLEACKELAFSTQEDFVTHGPVPPGGNVISDGDLLGSDCVICARNADLLLNTFDVDVDLGLDAADVIDVDLPLVAFSTELNSPHGNFTAGDLLVTNRVIIPNQALTYPFDVGYDIGLDAVHFVGNPEAIKDFLIYLGEHPLPDPAALAELLSQYEIDIWFSTEGTFGPVDNPTFLDGDLLSARDGVIMMAKNADLLPGSVPAGIPVRGVDFGLDAATSSRVGERELHLLHFSTEILFDGEPNFTDGDVLEYGDGVAATNYDLVKCFEPDAQELGLDALHMALEEPPSEDVFLPLALKNYE